MERNARARLKASPQKNHGGNGPPIPDSRQVGQSVRLSREPSRTAWRGFRFLKSNLPFLLLGELLLASFAYSQEIAEPAISESHWRSFFNSERLTGDWGGARTILEDRGFRFRFYANHQFAGCGGCPGSPRRNSGSLDLFVFLDVEEMGGWRGGEFMLLAKANSGVNINRLAGSLSDPIDDADFSVPAYIDQFWYQHSWKSRKVQLRIGYLDLQNIIDRNRYANSEDLQFLSTQLDNNSAVIPLKIGLGAALLLDPVDWFSLRIGISDDDNRILLAGFDTAFDGLDGLLSYLESGIRVGREGKSRTGNYRLGIFYDPTDKTPFLAGSDSAGRTSGDAGFFISADQQILSGGGGLPEAGLFFRLGLRESAVNRIARSWSAGVQISPLIPGMRGNHLGLGFYRLDASEKYRQATGADFRGETGLELYFRVELNRWLAVTPDVQWVVDPGGDRRAGNLFLLTLRSRFEF